MEYSKPPLTFDQQADLLASRGLIADKNILIERLKAVNYYRLTTYLYTFRENETDNNSVTYYKVNTTLDKIWRRYTFDRQLRLIVLDAIERVEVALKTQIAQVFSFNYGSFGHLDINSFEKSMKISIHTKFIDDLRKNVKISNEEFIKHFHNKYDEFPDLPLWVLIEIMSFGNLFTFYKNMKFVDRKKVASCYEITGNVFMSWIHTLNYIRNICAHHARLWNRKLSIIPEIPRNKNHPEWHKPETVDNTKIFAVLSLLS